MNKYVIKDGGIDIDTVMADYIELYESLKYIVIKNNNHDDKWA